MITSINVSPYEFVTRDFQIQLETEEELDPESAQSSLQILGQHALVSLVDGGKKAVLKTSEPLRPGPQTLVVDTLTDPEGHVISESLTIPFFVMDSKASIPENLRVQAYTQLVEGDVGLMARSSRAPAEGPYVEVMKAEDRATGAPVELAFDQNGRATDLKTLRKKVAASQERRFGKLHPQLHRRLDGAKADEPIEVAIWLREEPERLAEKSPMAESAAPPPERLRKRHVQVVERQQAVLKRLNGNARLSRPMEAAPYSPVMFIALTPEEIRRVEQDSDVAAVFLHDRSVVLDLNNSISIAEADAVHTQGQRGAGVRVAVFESGPDDTTNLSIAGQYINAPGSSSHARLTHGIIKNVQGSGPHGYAPDCELYSANSTNLAALDWAASQGCTVISQSFHRISEAQSDVLSFDDIYKDWLALRWPYPTIVQAAGNYFPGDPDGINPPDAEFVNHKGYNTLGVGNHNDAASAMSGSSVFRNPTSPHGDRELPELAANGMAVSAVGLTSSGTSFSAPAVAGCAALIQGINSVLKSWPEGCRAILLAGARRNVTGNTWWQDVARRSDTADGSGAVNASLSAEIARNRVARGNAPVRCGWDVGSLTSSSFDAQGMSTFVYQVQVPPTGGRHVKLVLAWDGMVSGTPPVSSTLEHDFDVFIHDAAGNIAGYSGSFDNSYEIAEFDGLPGQTYTIKLRRWSGTADVWYGLAWAVF